MKAWYDSKIHWLNISPTGLPAWYSNSSLGLIHAGNFGRWWRWTGGSWFPCLPTMATGSLGQKLLPSSTTSRVRRGATSGSLRKEPSIYSMTGSWALKVCGVVTLRMSFSHQHLASYVHWQTMCISLGLLPSWLILKDLCFLTKVRDYMRRELCHESHKIPDHVLLEEFNLASISNNMNVIWFNLLCL